MPVPWRAAGDLPVPPVLPAARAAEIRAVRVQRMHQRRRLQLRAPRKAGHMLKKWALRALIAVVALAAVAFAVAVAYTYVLVSAMPH